MYGEENIYEDDRIELGPNAEPLQVNEQGAKQSRVECRYDLLPPMTMLRVAGVLYQGAHSRGKGDDEILGEENWRKIPQRDHLNHAMIHIDHFRSGDDKEDHLAHAICRLIFATETK